MDSKVKVKDIAVIANCMEDFREFESTMATAGVDAKCHPIIKSPDLVFNSGFRCQAIAVLSNVERDEQFHIILKWVNDTCEGNKIRLGDYIPTKTAVELGIDI